VATVPSRFILSFTCPVSFSTLSSPETLFLVLFQEIAFPRSTYCERQAVLFLSYIFDSPFTTTLCPLDTCTAMLILRFMPTLTRDCVSPPSFMQTRYLETQAYVLSHTAAIPEQVTFPSRPLLHFHLFTAFLCVWVDPLDNTLEALPLPRWSVARF